MWHQLLVQDSTFHQTPDHAFCLPEEEYPEVPYLRQRHFLNFAFFFQFNSTLPKARILVSEGREETTTYFSCSEKKFALQIFQLTALLAGNKTLRRQVTFYCQKLYLSWNCSTPKRNGISWRQKRLIVKGRLGRNLSSQIYWLTCLKSPALAPHPPNTYSYFLEDHSAFSLHRWTQFSDYEFGLVQLIYLVSSLISF